MPISLPGLRIDQQGDQSLEGISFGQPPVINTPKKEVSMIDTGSAIKTVNQDKTYLDQNYPSELNQFNAQGQQIDPNTGQPYWSKPVEPPKEPVKEPVKRAKCPIYVAKAVLEASSVLQQDENKETPVENVSNVSQEKWGEILEKMTPDDFKYKR